MPFAFARKAKSSGPGRTTLRPRSWLRVPFGNRRWSARKRAAATALLGDFEITVTTDSPWLFLVRSTPLATMMMDRRRSWADPGGAYVARSALQRIPQCAPVRRTQEQRRQQEERREIVLQITERAMIGRPAAFQLVVKEWSVRKNVRRSRHAIRARSRRPDRNTWKGVRNRRPAEISRGPIGSVGGQRAGHPFLFFRQRVW